MKISNSESNLDAFKLILEEMKRAFIDELPERCNLIEHLCLNLEKNYSKDTYDDIFRHVHSLKGSGGTHGVLIVTTVCHQLENKLSELQKNLSTYNVSHLLSYVDLLREIADLEKKGIKDLTVIEEKLTELQTDSTHKTYSVLLAESSGMMRSLYEKIFSNLPVKITFVDDGLSALGHLTQEEFDIFIVAGELKCLNGVSVCLALRASESKNKNIKIILITSRTESVPVYADINYVLARNSNLAQKLSSVVHELIEVP